MIARKYVFAVVVLAAAVGLAAAITTFAANGVPANQPNGAWGGQMRGFGAGRGQGVMMRPVVFGTVSAVSGDIITVNGRQGFGANATTAAFTVDVTNAKVVKDNATSTVSSIAVGDTVVVQGTVSGKNVTATMIRDGKIGGQNGRGPNGGMNPLGRGATSTPIEGNGQPVLAGTVSAITGSTLSITNKSNVSYTIDASSAKITEGQDTVSLSSVNVGDSIIVQGTVNGTSVVASTIIDQTKPASGTTAQSGAQREPQAGIFAKIGQFFIHLFGF